MLVERLDLNMTIWLSRFKRDSIGNETLVPFVRLERYETSMVPVQTESATPPTAEITAKGNKITLTSAP